MSLLVIAALPLAAMGASALPLGRRVAPTTTLVAAILVLVQAVSVTAAVLMHGEVVAIAGWVETDVFGALILLLVAWVSLLAALYSVGYLDAGSHAPDTPRLRFYYVHLNLFIFALLAVPMLSEPAFAWIGIEFAALFSVLLVAYANTHEALEAAWKYIALMFMGAAIALLGFLILFWAQQTAGGGVFTWNGLRVTAGMPPTLIAAAFAFVLVGFGTKVGFVPLHTWLPDAHSQAPAPVCALLSGVKTTVALYCILRLVPLLAPAHAQTWLQVVGLLSVGVAAFLLLQVRDYKRMFAFSTVEHMGVIFTAVGLGVAARPAALMQVVSHSLTKSFCFFAAGSVLLAFGTREIAGVRGVLRRSPVAGVALMFGALAIGGAPPMSVFLSEFSIFRGGLADHRYVAIALLAMGIVVAFFGIMRHVNQMVFGADEPDAGGPASGAGQALPVSCRLVLLLGAVPVLVLGVWLPAPLHALVQHAAQALAP
jgi:hydrogenase-4 component F